ncbi:MAG: FAD:protein FMN transferase, partial [Acidobacteriota bacterium]
MRRGSESRHRLSRGGKRLAAVAAALLTAQIPAAADGAVAARVMGRQAAARAIGPAQPRAVEKFGLGQNVGTVAVRRAWMIMGTALEITVYRPPAEHEVAVVDLRAGYAAVQEVDRRMSLYRDDSELVLLNSRAGEGFVPVSPGLYQVLAAAVHYQRASGGAFDATVTPLVQLWGFYRQQGQSVPPPFAIEAELRKVGAGRIELQPGHQMVALAPETRVDLGAIAKGYAVDRVVDTLAARGVPAALVNLGGNIGVFGSPPGGDAWSVGVRHPRPGTALLGNLEIPAGWAVATSGDYERFFEADGRRYSHLLDPRTGWPVQEIMAVTVVAPDGMTADALSTAAFVLGRQEGLALLESCIDVEGLVVVRAEAVDGGARRPATRTEP